MAAGGGNDSVRTRFMAIASVEVFMQHANFASNISGKDGMHSACFVITSCGNNLMQDACFVAKSSS